MTHKMKLTVKLKDGRTLSGTYPILVAMARQEAALKEWSCESAILEDAE
jgi:hypothetical protein